MSDYSEIQTELDDFENAVYGEEVRDSMVSAIKKIYDRTTPLDASSATSGQVPTADGNGDWEWADPTGGSSSGTGWTSEEITLLETILRNAHYSTDQSTNITSLISALNGGTSYSITWSGTGYTAGNSATSVSDGASFTSTITANTGYTIDSVTVTMGGNTVSGAYSSGTITIPSVTGDIVITVTTTAEAGTVSVSLSPTSGTVTAGSTTTATITTTGSATLSATSSDTSVATASISGSTLTITGVASGSATITVTYGTASATYTATVEADLGWTSGVAYDMTDGITSNYYLNNGTETAYNGWSISPYLPCNGAFIVSDTAFTLAYTARYDSDKNYINKITIKTDLPLMWSDADFIRVSDSTSKVTGAVITPYALDSIGESDVWQSDVYYAPTFTSGGYYNDSGVLISHSDYEYSGYINCYNASSIFDNKWGTWRRYCFYDGDKTFISQVEVIQADQNLGNFTVPTGARYVTISLTESEMKLCFKMT